MKVLLTGATGFLGNNLLRLLLEDGHSMTVTVRHGSDTRPLKGLSVEQVICDLADPEQASAIVGDSDLVIHSAAMIHIGWKKLGQSRQVNVASTNELARACRMRGIRMIHVSTVDAFAAGSPNSPTNEQNLDPPKSGCSYVVSKREAELAFKKQVDAGLDGVIVNPGFMIGPWDWKPSSGEMLLAVATRFTPFAPSGGCSCVDVRDTACGIISAMKHGKRGENYILAGHNVTYFDLWTKIAKITSSRPPRLPLPAWAGCAAGKVGDVMAAVTGKESIVNSAAVAMGSLFNFHCSNKAKQELGYQIGDLDTAIFDAWEWFKAYGYASV